MLLPRNLVSKLLDAAGDTPVVMINGARQSGKSTLIQRLFSGASAPRYITFDDLNFLDAARRDPQGFILSLPEKVILDEIQRVPEIMLPIKYSVDLNRKPGRFFLTGSADVLALPKVADTLVGRIEIHTLWPLSQGEILGVKESFVDEVFGLEPLKKGKTLNLVEIFEMLCTGGYPDAIEREVERRQSWFHGYLTTLIERDVRDLRNIDQLTVMPKLLKLLAARAGCLMNNSDMARSLEINVSTLRNYLSLLHQLFLLVPVQPWFSNKGKRLVKTPKIFFNDSGLLCHLLDCDAAALSMDSSLLGPVFENFCVMELMKQITWSDLKPRLYHFRTESGYEVDIVLEAQDGRIVGIECKSGMRINSDTFKGLRALKEIAGKKFVRGIVLYSGKEVLPFDKQFQAVPVSTLWESNIGAAPKLLS